MATSFSAYTVLRAEPSAVADLMYEMLGCALTVSQGPSWVRLGTRESP